MAGARGPFSIIDSERLAWEEDGQRGVWRKPLEQAGNPPGGRRTSLVRLAPGVDFPHHVHMGGEEVFVVEGVWRDENGVYPTGTYVVSPDGSAHSPSSPEGCLLFVKHNQLAQPARRRAVCRAEDVAWQPSLYYGINFKTLYQDEGYPERVRLVHFQPGVSLQRQEHAGVQELLILNGRVRDENGWHGAGTWMRHPGGSSHSVGCPGGCLFLLRTAV